MIAYPITVDPNPTGMKTGNGEVLEPAVMTSIGVVVVNNQLCMIKDAHIFVHK